MKSGNNLGSRPGQIGFTIVELLIVIVVIGILAAITIVAYNGIQQRARNSQVVTGVSTYYRAMLQYATLNGSYPTTTGCLGAGYPSNQCWQGDSGTYYTDATLDAAMATVITSKPTLATSLFSIGITNNVRAGALYDSSTKRLVYYLQGPGQSCGISSAGSYTEGGVVTQCAVNLP